MRQLLMKRARLDDLPEAPRLPAGCSLRACRESDLPSLANLLRLAFDDESWDVDRVRRDLFDAPDVVTIHIVVCGKDVLATASSRRTADYPGDGYLHWVASHPQHRGQGLGRIICLAVLDEFRALGCEGAVLETQDPRLPAIKTYLGLGFEPVMRDETHHERWQAIHNQLRS